MQVGVQSLAEEAISRPRQMVGRHLVLQPQPPRPGARSQERQGGRLCPKQTPPVTRPAASENVVHSTADTHGGLRPQERVVPLLELQKPGARALLRQWVAPSLPFPASGGGRCPWLEAALSSPCLRHTAALSL